jgi:hypothetical protein
MWEGDELGEVDDGVGCGKLIGGGGVSACDELEYRRSWTFARRRKVTRIRIFFALLCRKNERR